VAQGQTIRRTRRFARRLTRRVKWPLSNALCNSYLNVDATVTTLVIHAFSDFFEDTATLAAINGSHKIHRVQFKGDILPTWQTVTRVTTGSAWCWALYKAQTEDVDDGLFDATDNAFANHQIIKWGLSVCNITEVPDANMDDNIIRSPARIAFDVKFRKPMMLRTGEDLRLALQSLNSLTGVWSAANLVAFQRTIVQPAQAGR